MCDTDTDDVFQVVYGFDVLKLISENGETNGECKQPVRL